MPRAASLSTEPRVWADVCAAIAAATGASFKIEMRAAVAGGSINQCYRIAGSGRIFFVKLNSSCNRSIFEGEAAGLAALAATATIRVPSVICLGTTDNCAWLTLEYIEFVEPAAHGMTRLGERLAALHRNADDRFGWVSDNTLGATPQPNSRTADWPSFWRKQRLGHQLTLAADNAAPKPLLDKGARLADGLDVFFATCDVKPALLHGDLWGGNAGFDSSGSPVIFDPAVYYGDREADLAMTELFGGFSAAFYAAYRSAYPLDPGYAVRKQLYNLYHVLNHFNLFGGSYARQAETLIDRLLAEL